MWKTFTPKTFLLISISLIATIILGAQNLVVKKNIAKHIPEKSIVAPMSATAVASSSESSRQEFLLAADLIDRKQGKAALAKLQGLEQEYPLLAPYILLSQGKAYQLENNQAEAEKVWQKLVNNYANSPATAEGLYLLGTFNPAYWQRAIIKFPSHPRTHEIIRQKLVQNPNQPRLMAILVKHSPDDRDIDEMRDRLVVEYSSQLTAEDWEAIADSYWIKWDYGAAGKAYAKAPRTSRNLYRAARGYHIANSKTTAKQFYKQLIREYPNAVDTGLGLRRLAMIVDKKEGLNYLDLAIQKFPHQAPQALLEKANLLDKLQSPKSASQARQIVLNNHKHSESAAEYRWKVASKKAKAGDLVGAWQWAQPIVLSNPDSPIAPKAG
ncbi:MAG: tol-pal system YbgF family protein, partial [Pleurocapsa sp.]